MIEDKGVKNQRVVITRYGGPGVLQVVEEDLPVPKFGEARVCPGGRSFIC